MHSIAHHGVSALSWLHPRLGEEAKLQSCQTIEIDLLRGSFSTKGFAPSRESEKAANALSERFWSVAETEGIQAEDLCSAQIEFGFEHDGWPSVCWASMNNTEQEKTSVKVDGFGKRHHDPSKHTQSHS